MTNNININYLKFMKQAAKVTKAASGARPILKGVNHTEEGELVATDSHRLYYASGANAPTGVIIDPVSGKELDVGTYPDFKRLIPKFSDAQAVLHYYDTSTMVKALKAMHTVGRVDGTTRANVEATLDGSTLIIGSYEEALTSSLDLANVDGDVNDILIGVNALYLVEAVEFLEKMGANSVDVLYYGHTRPFILKPTKADNLLALILPLRRYNDAKKVS